jgi:hypothetical protein
LGRLLIEESYDAVPTPRECFGDTHVVCCAVADHFHSPDRAAHPGATFETSDT